MIVVFKSLDLIERDDEGGAFPGFYRRRNWPHCWIFCLPLWGHLLEWESEEMLNSLVFCQTLPVTITFKVDLAETHNCCSLAFQFPAQPTALNNLWVSTLMKVQPSLLLVFTALSLVNESQNTTCWPDYRMKFYILKNATRYSPKKGKQVDISSESLILRNFWNEKQ